MSRLTRKEMKRDEVLDLMGRTVKFVRENARLVLTIAAVAVAVAAIVAAVIVYRGKQAERANLLLAEAMVVLEAPIDAVSPEPEDPNNPTFADQESRRQSASAKLEAVHKEFAGQPVGAIAAAYLGDLAVESGEGERAEALWREAIEGVQDSFLAGRLELNLINLARSQGRAEAAVEQLRELLNSVNSPLPGDVLLYQLASTLEELGRPSEAESAYRRLLEDYDSSPYAAEAQRKLDEL